MSKSTIARAKIKIYRGRDWSEGLRGREKWGRGEARIGKWCLYLNSVVGERGVEGMKETGENGELAQRTKADCKREFALPLYLKERGEG